MVQGKVEEASNYAIPEGTCCPAVLTSVEQKVIPYVVRKGNDEGKTKNFVLWEWEFTITDGPYSGQTLSGGTEPKITDGLEQSSDLKLARPWYEAILGRPLSHEEDIDSDVLIGYPCQVVVEHKPPRPKKDGAGSWFNIAVGDVLRPGAEAPVMEPPF